MQVLEPVVERLIDADNEEENGVYFPQNEAY
jgi:hypothetical protein